MEYSLTERGKKLFPGLNMIQQWAIETFQNNETIK
ncbi:winged helix-turn-helix transcriptional regulator [Clostridium algifaecis]